MAMAADRPHGSPDTPSLTATPPWFSERIMPASPTMMARNCNGFRLTASVGFVCVMHLSPMGNEMSTITGMTMTKIERHGQILATAPPTVGPMAGATVMTSEPTPMSLPTLERGDCSRMMLIISGVAMPEPTP